MSLYTPNLKVLKDWRGSLNVAFSILRRVAFVVESTFSFGDFDPQVNWQGMTATNVSIKRARYLKIFKMLWISVEVTATLAAPFAASFSIIIPGTAYGETGTYQSGATLGQNGGVGEGAFWLLQGTTNEILTSRAAFGAYTAGSARFALNTFVETI